VAGTTIPISKTNVVLLTDVEKAWGVLNTTPVARQLAFDTHAIARTQTLTPNAELRGTRKVGAYIPGQKAPGGQFKQHLTDITTVMWIEAMLGKRVTTEVVPLALTVSAALVSPAAAGNVDTGTHSYKITVTKGVLGETIPSAKSNVVTVADKATNGKVKVTRSGGTLPSTWTWSVYRTIVGDAGDWELVVAGLGAAVTTYTDNVADSGLGAAAPTSSAVGAGDYQHVITCGDALPSYSFERQHPYQNGDFDYVLALGAVCDTANLSMAATGFDDFDGTFLAKSVANFASSQLLPSGSATEWRYGEKLHDAMIGSGKVLLDDATFVGYVVDLKYAHNNNLDKSDYPLGLQGDRGSAIPMQITGTLTGNLKVSDKSVLPLLQDYSTLHSLSVEFDFATTGHSKVILFEAIQFDPADAPVSGQGILTVPFNGHVVQDPTSGEMVTVTIINGEPTTSYDPPA